MIFDHTQIGFAVLTCFKFRTTVDNYQFVGIQTTVNGTEITIFWIVADSFNSIFNTV